MENRERIKKIKDKNTHKIKGASTAASAAAASLGPPVAVVSNSTQPTLGRVAGQSGQTAQEATGSTNEVAVG